MNETITTKELAAILGISITRVNELGRKGRIQREPDGCWNLVKVNAALRRNLDKHQTLKSLGQAAKAENLDMTGQDAGQSFSEAQRQREWIRVKKEEMELRKRRGELIEADEVSRTWCDITAVIQSRMLMVAAKAAPKITDGMSVQERSATIEHAIREALTALSEYEPNAA